MKPKPPRDVQARLDYHEQLIAQQSRELFQMAVHLRRLLDDLSTIVDTVDDTLSPPRRRKPGGGVH